MKLSLVHMDLVNVTLLSDSRAIADVGTPQHNLSIEMHRSKRCAAFLKSAPPCVSFRRLRRSEVHEMASLQSMPAPMKRSALAIDTSGSTSPSHSNVDTGRSNQANSDDPASEELHRDFVMSPLTAQTPLRTHVPDATSSTGSSNPESLSTSSERIFQQLDSIRNLHQNILKDHAKLAGLDTLYQSERGQDGLEDGLGSTKGHDDPAGRKDRDKDRRGEDQGDEQTGAASYEQMAADFARRQDGVEGIMRQVSREV